MGSLLKKLGAYSSVLIAESKMRSQMNKPEYTGYVAGNTYHITGIKKVK